MAALLPRERVTYLLLLPQYRCALRRHAPLRRLLLCLLPGQRRSLLRQLCLLPALVQNEASRQSSPWGEGR